VLNLKVNQPSDVPPALFTFGFILVLVLVGIVLLHLLLRRVVGCGMIHDLGFGRVGRMSRLR
jgi:hypothetical protein